MIQINKIKGYEHIKEFYYVNEKGQIFSRSSAISENLKELKQYEKTGGYMNVALMAIDGKVKYIRVNRLVAAAYIANPNGKSYVHHKDENRKNNNADNLEWATPKENNDYSLSKKVYCYDKIGNLINIYSSTKEAEEKTKFNRGHIAAVSRGKERSHKGYVFSYVPLSKNEVKQKLENPFYT